jgi:transposase
MSQKIQVITGVERRRRYSIEEKRRIVAESNEPLASVSDVARRNGVAVNLLFAWRKAFKRGSEDLPQYIIDLGFGPRVAALREQVSAAKTHSGARLAKFPDEIRSEVLSLLADGLRAAEICMATGLPPTTVSRWIQAELNPEPAIRELTVVQSASSALVTALNQTAMIRIGSDISIELAVRDLSEQLLKKLVKLKSES